ncbi:hypothetical protein ACGRHY_13025 [Streptomyces sp. HK10]|uniref:hypothetical protein n=1 Tax=Streptomyces sp. HK10 TaxID=3373255 RepID=UPI003749B628
MPRAHGDGYAAGTGGKETREAVAVAGLDARDARSSPTLTLVAAPARPPPRRRPPPP